MIFKKTLIIVLLCLPFTSSAAVFQFPNGKWFAEFNVNGHMIWSEVIGPISYAKAKEFSWRDTLEDYMRAMAGIYGVNPIEILETNQGESQWNSPPDKFVKDYAYRALEIKGDKGLACGVAQWHKSTFDLWKKEAGMPELKYCFWQDDLKLQAWAFSKGIKYKDDWTVYRDVFIKKKRPMSANWNW